MDTKFGCICVILHFNLKFLRSYSDTKFACFRVYKHASRTFKIWNFDISPTGMKNLTIFSLTSKICMIMWMKSDRELKKNNFSSIQAFECLILQKLFLRSGTEKILYIRKTYSFISGPTYESILFKFDRDLQKKSDK